MRGALEWLAGDTCEWDDVSAIVDYLKRKRYEVLLEIAKSGSVKMANELIARIGRIKFTIDELDAAISMADAQKNDPVKKVILTYKSAQYSTVQVAANEIVHSDKKQGILPLSLKEASRLYQITGNATNGYTLLKYLGDEASVVVPSMIGSGSVVYLDGTFCACKHVTSVKIPNTVVRLGRCTFEHSGITSIEIPSSVTELENNVFKGSALKSVVIPSTVKKIGKSLFADCKSLTSVRIDAKISVLEENTFARCSALDSFVIPLSVKKINRSCFTECSALESIILHEKITTIEEEAFSKSGLKSIQIPSKVERIGILAFACCKALTSVTLCDGVKEILPRCFLGCERLSEVKLPASLKGIWQMAFAHCLALTSIEIPEGTIVGSGVFLNCPIGQ